MARLHFMRPYQIMQRPRLCRDNGTRLNESKGGRSTSAVMTVRESYLLYDQRKADA